MADEELCERYQVTLDILDEIRQNFAEFDLDGNGHITTKELGSVLKSVGKEVPGYQLRDMVAEIDRDKNGTIELEEFISMYSSMKSKEVASTFLTALSKREGIEAKGGTSMASSEGTTHSVADEETSAFAEYINSNLKDDPDLKDRLPIDAKSSDLFKSVNDGFLLCKMVNLSVPDTIDERAINRGKLNLYLQHENLTLALNSASSIGCKTVNIGPDDLIRGTEHLVLGLMWQIIRVGLFAKIDLQHNPGLFRLLEEGETLEELMKLTPEELLIRWVNYQMDQAGNPRRISNFSSDITDSEVYTYLLKQISPADAGCDLTPMMESDLTERAEKMLTNADKIGCRQFVQASDVVHGQPKLNMAFVANLFNMYPNLQAPEDGEGDDFDRFEETREEKTFRNWMNSLGISPYVQHLYTDLCDGLVILQLIDSVKPNCVQWNRVTRPPWPKIGGGGKMKKIENCNYAVLLGNQMKFSLVGIDGNDIHNGIENLTLALVWQLMRAYTLRILQQISESEQPITDKQVVEWCNKKLKSAGKTSSIEHFQDPGISDSRAVVDLIDAIKTGSINYKNFRENPISDTDKFLNAKYAISMARKIGAPVYALPEDLVEVKPQMVMTVFACLMARGMTATK